MSALSSSTVGPSSNTLRDGAVHVMFLASGAASLICQVIWFKQLQFVLGSSTFAVSVTVASFFLGLSLGSWVGGTWADRLRRPLLTYGLLELNLSVVSFGVTVLLSKWSVWALGLAPLLGDGLLLSRLLTVSLSFSILLLPTMLMGATLPLLAKHLVRERQTLARRIGLLYGLNTLGAAAIGRSVPLAPAATVEDEAPGAVSSRPAQRAPVGVGVLVLVFAVSGFVSIAYEVLWFRVSANFSLHTVFAFSAMLSTYLLGLVLGAFICARYLAPRKDRLLAYFAQLQLLIAGAGLLTLALLAARGKSAPA